MLLRNMDAKISEFVMMMKQSQKEFKDEMTKTISESVVKAVAESKVDNDGIQLILIFHDLSFTNTNTNIIYEY